MANEISVTLGLNVNKGGAQLNRSESKVMTMTGDSFIHSIQAVETGGTLLVEPTILGNGGMFFIKNLDTTNFITVGAHATSNHPILLQPGESCLFRCWAGTMYGKANNASCDVEYIIVEV